MWVAVPSAGSQGAAWPSAASGCLHPAAPALGGGSLGQPLDREAYRQAQAVAAERGAGASGRGAGPTAAAAVKPQRGSHTLIRAPVNPQPARRQRPQPRARASEPLVVFDDARGGARGGAAPDEPVAAPLYERASVALGRAEPLLGAQTGAPLATAVAGACARVERARSLEEATGTKTREAPERDSAAAALPEGGHTSRPTEGQAEAAQANGGLTAPASLPAEGYRPVLALEAVPELHAALAPADRPSEAAQAPEMSAPQLEMSAPQLEMPAQLAACSGAATAALPAAAEAAEVGSGAVRPQGPALTEPSSMQLSQPPEPASVSATAHASQQPQSGAAGGAAIQAGRQAAVVNLDSKKSKKKRKRASSSANPAGALLGFRVTFLLSQI